MANISFPEFVPSFYDCRMSATLIPVQPAREPAPVSRARGVAGLLVGVLLVALNLRAAVTSLGALLEEVSGGLHIGGSLAGVVTMLPALSFAAFGALTPRLARRYSPRTLFLAAMAVLAAGQLARALTASPVVFLATSALALSGIAIANVLLPGYVRRVFPTRAGLITGVYTMTLILGTALAAATSVPIAHAAGSWRVGLGAWGLLAVVAMVPWLAVRGGTPERPATVPAKIRPSKTRIGWLMALYFGTQSLSGYAVMGWLAQLYRDAGFSPQTAGLLLAGVTAVGVPIALLLPVLASRRDDQRVLVVVLGLVLIGAYLGLAVAPRAGAMLWVVALAVGQAAFPLVLTLIGMRARTAAGTVALSAFAQSWGYLIAALGPLAVGVLYDVTGGWTVPLGLLAVVAVVQLLAGLGVARPGYVEDALT
jgi:CP family cyanate transporter-like MFS transporter